MKAKTNVTIAELVQRARILEDLYDAIYRYYCNESTIITVKTRKREDATVYVIPPDEAEMLLEYITYQLNKPASALIPSSRAVAKTIIDVFLKRKTPYMLLFESEEKEVSVPPYHVPVIIYREYRYNPYGPPATYWRLEALEIPTVRICLVC